MDTYRSTTFIKFEFAMMKPIHHWLNYMCKVSRVDLLAEDAIKFPLMEYIERNLPIERGQLECNYKELLAEDIYNMDKSVDIMWEDSDTEYLIELKYVKNDTKAKKQHYFNDLVRLSLALKLKNGKKKRRCFFVVCGKTTEFREQFQGVLPQEEYKGGNALERPKRGRKPSKPFANWLSFDSAIDEGYKDILYNTTPNITPFRNFIKEYFNGDDDVNGGEERKHRVRKINKAESVKHLCSFHTKYIWVSDNKEDEQSTGLWEIMLSKE